MTGAEATVRWDGSAPNLPWAVESNEADTTSTSGLGASGMSAFEPLPAWRANHAFIEFGSVLVNRVPNKGPTSFRVSLGRDWSDGDGKTRPGTQQPGSTNTLTHSMAALADAGATGGGLATGEAIATALPPGGSTAANVTLSFGGIIGNTLGGGNRALALKAVGNRPTLNEASAYDQGTTLGSGTLQMRDFNALRAGTAASLSLAGETTEASDMTLAESGSYFHFNGGSVSLIAVASGFSLKAVPASTENVTTLVSSGPGGPPLAVPLRQAAPGGSGIDERISLLGSFNSADLNNVMAVNQFAGSGANFSIGVARSGSGLQPLNAVPEFRPIYAGCLLLGVFGWTERRRLRRLFPRASAA